jgi:hypothetical protein
LAPKGDKLPKLKVLDKFREGFEMAAIGRLNKRVHSFTHKNKAGRKKPGSCQL